MEGLSTVASLGFSSCLQQRFAASARVHPSKFRTRTPGWGPGWGFASRESSIALAQGYRRLDLAPPCHNLETGEQWSINPCVQLFSRICLESYLSSIVKHGSLQWRGFSSNEVSFIKLFRSLLRLSTAVREHPGYQGYRNRSQTAASAKLLDIGTQGQLSTCATEKIEVNPAASRVSYGGVYEASPVSRIIYQGQQ